MLHSEKMSCHGQWKPAVGMVVVNFGFGILNVLFKKILDEGTNHMVLVTYRMSIATMFMAPIAYYWERKSRHRLTASILFQLFSSALVGLTLSQYLFLLGLEYTSATFTCGFLNTVPVTTFILALPFGLEKVNTASKAGWAKVLGALICLSGAVVLTLYKGIPLTSSHSQATASDTSNQADTMISGKKPERWFIGSMLSLGGCVTWSSWFLIQAKISKSYPCQYSSTAIMSFLGGIQSAVVALIIEKDANWILKTKWEIISALYAGIIGSGFCYVALSWCVKQRGPVFTSAFTPLTQIFAAIFDFAILHEQIYLGSLLGSILVIIGLYILLWGKSTEAEEECEAKQDQAAKPDEICDPESQASALANSRRPQNPS